MTHDANQSDGPTLFQAHRIKFSRLGWGLPCLLATALVACAPPEGNLNLTDAPLSSQYAPSLGTGVNYAETRTFRRCVKVPDVVIEAEESQGSGSHPTSVTRSYKDMQVKSRKELDDVLDISAEVRAKALFGAVGAEAGCYKNVRFSEDSFYWVVDARYEFETKMLDTGSSEFGLTDEAKSILSGPGGIKDFYAACGHHFYSGRRLGAHYGLLYELSTHEDEILERIRASANYSGYGAAMKSSFDSLSKMAQRVQSVRVHSLTEGGDDTLEEHANDAPALNAELVNIHSKISKDKQGVVTQWIASDYTMFPEVLFAARAEKTTLASQKSRSDNLAFYYDSYIANQTRSTHLQRLLEKAQGSEPSLYFSAQDLARIQANLEGIAAQNHEIKKRASNCIHDESSDCSVVGLSPMSGPDPLPIKSMRRLGDWTFEIARSPGSKLYMDFIGQRSGDERRYRFPTNSAVANFSGTNVLLETPRSDGIMGRFKIGNLENIIDEETGRSRPNICLGRQESFCTLRVVESPDFDSETVDKGFAMLQILVFNQFGLLTDKLNFRATANNE